MFLKNRLFVRCEKIYPQFNDEAIDLWRWFPVWPLFTQSALEYFLVYWYQWFSFWWFFCL